MEVVASTVVAVVVEEVLVGVVVAVVETAWTVIAPVVRLLELEGDITMVSAVILGTRGVMRGEVIVAEAILEQCRYGRI